jgi:hypothetical protein
MPKAFVAPLLACGLLMIPAASVGAAEPASQPVQSSPAPAVYSTASTNIGTLLDNPASKAVLEKHVPQLLANSQLEMAHSMSLKQIQSYASDMVTDEVLAKIDADLTKVPTRK